MRGDSIKNLLEVISRLRAPNGCPWDREQTHKSIRGHLVEECAELLEAIDNNNTEEMREELGDVLMHILLHCQIANEENRFDFDDVANELADKLVRRHPHVFGERKAENADEVIGIWKDVKKKENKKRVIGGLFDGIPPQLSALRYALDIAKKADSETIAIAKNAADTKNSAQLEIGKKLFEYVEEAVKAKIEPESALRDFIAEIKIADANKDA